MKYLIFMNTEIYHIPNFVLFHLFDVEITLIKLLITLLILVSVLFIAACWGAIVWDPRKNNVRKMTAMEASNFLSNVGKSSHIEDPLYKAVELPYQTGYTGEMTIGRTDIHKWIQEKRWKYLLLLTWIGLSPILIMGILAIIMNTNENYELSFWLLFCMLLGIYFYYWLWKGGLK